MARVRGNGPYAIKKLHSVSYGEGKEGGGGGSGEGKEGGGEGVERGRRVGGGSGEGKVGGGGREWVGFVAHLTCVVLCDALYLPHGNYWDTKS